MRHLSTPSGRFLIIEAEPPSKFCRRTSTRHCKAYIKGLVAVVLPSEVRMARLSRNKVEMHVIQKGCLESLWAVVGEIVVGMVSSQKYRRRVLPGL